jgi:hypothetical protein
MISYNLSTFTHCVDVYKRAVGKGLWSLKTFMRLDIYIRILEEWGCSLGTRSRLRSIFHVRPSTPLGVSSDAWHRARLQRARCHSTSSPERSRGGVLGDRAKSRSPSGLEPTLSGVEGSRGRVRRSSEVEISSGLVSVFYFYLCPPTKVLYCDIE